MERKLIEAKIGRDRLFHKWTWSVKFSDGETRHGPVHDDLLDNLCDNPSDEALTEAIVIECPGVPRNEVEIMDDGNYPATEGEATKPRPRAAIWIGLPDDD